MAGLSIFMILIIFTYWLICYIFVVALGFIVYPSNNISPHIYYKNLKQYASVSPYVPLYTVIIHFTSTLFAVLSPVIYCYFYFKHLIIF